MDDITRDVADALVWLDLQSAQALLRSLLQDSRQEQEQVIRRLVPDLVGVVDLDEPRWIEAMLDELELRVAPGDEDDPDDVATREVPNLARFATDRRK